ncbi:Sel1 repeat protein [Ancylostoma duodenale]|uniref:Sel1 repeat protein n=1 Tax=Ancylostoma duodenale TaxID=51022 RepID=A0A0C2FI97_9BILA|nr:Sel1 repeat protein [Ancylostoma duodenale]
MSSQRLALSNIIRHGQRFVQLPHPIPAQSTSSDTEQPPPNVGRLSDVVLPLVNCFNNGPPSLQFSPLLGGSHWVPSLVLSGAGPLSLRTLQGNEHAVPFRIPAKPTICEVGVQTDDGVSDLLAQLDLNPSKEEKTKWELENLLGEELLRKGEQKDAILRFQAAASHGNADAMNKLAEFLFTGKGVVPNKTKALHLWEQAAALGQVSAMYSLAVWQLNAASDGDKTVDKMRALRLMRRAAAGGNPHAAFYLVVRYIRDSDLESAKPVIRVAAQDEGYASQMRSWVEEKALTGKFSGLVLQELSPQLCENSIEFQ